MMNRYNKYIGVVAICIILFACKTDKKNTTSIDSTPKPPVKVPMVAADSAYHFIEKQLSFGVRVPGSPGHIQCRDWIVNKMKSLGADVKIQEFKASFLTKSNISSYNIIAKINPTQTKRIALFAHWDSRLIAEKDSDATMKDKPIMGAIDGASGVAALIEIARLLKAHPVDLGVDFIFFDAEDQGDDSGNWCIGSQFWAKSVQNDENKPQFGILLDLIGAKGATYGMEKYSMEAAPDLVRKIWDLASKMNKSHLFSVYDGGAIMDDHYYVNTMARIPTIDIIQTTPNGSFGHYHHTHKDNISEVDKTVLSGVIQVVTAVVYKTYDGTF
jgi:Zn-dependent M28 family amino/carboxypeptidase